MGLNFQPFIDAVCRKCEAYFKNFPHKQCPCCKQRVGRHAKKGKSIKHRLFTAFADFWRLILKEKKQYDLKHNLRLHKNIAKRSCLVCGSSNTYHVGRTKTAMWISFRDGYVCGKCYNRMKYRVKYSKKIPLSEPEKIKEVELYAIQRRN
jgi:hypothetical protein